MLQYEWLLLYAVILITRGSTTNATQMLSSTSSHSSISQEMHAIGGGAINEKQRLYQQSSKKITTNNNDSTGNNDSTNNDTSWNPNEHLSHILHALVGLDRYPHYLNRISDIDTLALEHALESKLSDVRKQRAEINQRRAGIKQLVRRYMMDKNYIVDDEDTAKDNTEEHCGMLWKNHPLLSPPKDWIDLRERNILQEAAFKVAHQSTNKKRRKPKSKKDNTQLSMTDIIEGKVQVDLDPSLLEDLLQQEMYDVYSIPLLTPEFCNILRTTLRELSKLAETTEFAHLQLGRRVIDLDLLGLGWITDLLFHMYIQPISQHLFAQTEKLVASDSDSASTIDWRQGYVAGYSAQPSESKGATRHRLVPHTDDAEVTLNCCLGEENYEGGSVEFYGLRGTEEEGQLIGVARRPNVGTALLHSGRHLHAVESVSKGDRYALIIWTRSWMNLRKTTCPCCWLNRRQDSTCICNQRWN